MTTADEKARRQIRVADLTQRGYSAVEIATQLGVDARTVVRDRTDIGLDPGTTRDAIVERRRPKCGTPEGYGAHQRRHERACDDCRRAHSNRHSAYCAERRGHRTTKIANTLLADLYRAAPPDIQARMKDELGGRLTRALNNTSGEVRFPDRGAQ